MTTDAGSAFAHPLQAKVSAPPLVQNRRINAQSIVLHAQCEILRVLQGDFQLTAPGMPAGIADGLVAYSI